MPAAKTTRRAAAPAWDEATIARLAGRKGARRRSEVPAEVVAGLNAGALATVNLVEALVLDLPALMEAAFPELGSAAPAAVRAAEGYLGRMQAAGLVLSEAFGPKDLPRLAAHPSDTVRGWACYMVGFMPKLSIERRLKLIRPFAADAHFGVREWAWLATRPALADDLAEAVRILTPWAHDSQDAVRRFASEVTRPRGVWCARLAAMVEDPSLGLPILEPLRADESRYVRLSVGNWLNDASKSQPQWVQKLVADWRKQSPCKATQEIAKRALRTLMKN